MKGEAVIEERSRKASPSDEFRVKLECVMGRAQGMADGDGEDLILKTAFLSKEDNDVRSRERMERLREEKKAKGWVAVSVWLDPSQVAAVRARGRSNRVATALGNVIDKLAVAPSSAFVPDLEDEEDAPAEGGVPEGAEVMTGSVVELWVLRDGTLDGCLRQGVVRGARLSSLAFGALIGLWHLSQVSTNQDDPAMVEAFLDRRFPDWREQGSPEGQEAAALAEPYEVLGVLPSATDDEVKAAYRKAVQAAHPDKGGSRWLFQAVQGAWAAIRDARKPAGE